jgi:hypothetical protein
MTSKHQIAMLQKEATSTAFWPRSYPTILLTPSIQKLLGVGGSGLVNIGNRVSQGLNFRLAIQTIPFMISYQNNHESYQQLQIPVLKVIFLFTNIQLKSFYQYQFWKTPFSVDSFWLLFFVRYPRDWKQGKVHF